MRTKILSTGRLNVYKIVNLIIWLLFLAVIIFNLLGTEDPSLIEYYWFIYWGVLFVLSYVRRTLKLRNIEYDDDNIYIVDKAQEVVIPFISVKKIKLQSLDGVHSIFLSEHLGLGKEIWFKSSLWYPFNFKKVDEEVYRLQLKIEKVKSKHYENPITSLPSQTG